MLVNILFYIAFLGQILLISYLLPRKINKSVHYVLDNFPPADYPKLYPMPYEHYAKQYKSFVLLCWIIFVLGIVLLSLFISGQFEEDMQTVVPQTYFFIQYIPVILIEIASRKQLKLMRSDSNRRTREATLQPRRFLDFIPAGIGGAAAAVYCSFVVLTIGTELYDPQTANGYYSLAMVTSANLFFLGIIFWNLYGNKQDPYQSNETRQAQIRMVAKALLLISIAATLYVSFTIVLNLFEIESAEGISLCFYLQLISLLNMSSFKLDNVDFSVYKEAEAVG